MCIQQIESLKEKFNLPIEICDICDGNGTITTFCGHDVEETCQNCEGEGYLITRKKGVKVE